MEWNPFRPDIPSQIVDLGHGLYDYLREQAELLREQHNQNQAGDSTFPWQLMTETGARRIHTPGALGRFVHEHHGLIYARYVQFSRNWNPVSHAWVAHDKTDRDWVATNQASKTHALRVIGIAASDGVDLANQYGWAVTHGRLPYAVEVLTASAPAPFQPLTWIPESASLTVGVGPQVGFVLPETTITLIEPGRWLIPASSFFVDIQGVTPEYIKQFVLDGLASVEPRIQQIESSVSGLSGQSQATGQLQSQLDSIKDQLTSETRLRVLGDSNQLTQLRNLETQFNQLRERLDLSTVDFQFEEANRLISSLQASVQTLNSDSIARLQNLETWRARIESQLSGLVVTVQGFSDLAGSTVGFTPSGSLSATDIQSAIEELDAEKLASTPSLDAFASSGISDPWTAYTPVVAPAAGAFASAVGFGRYIKIGRLVILWLRIRIATNGTGAQFINVSLPFPLRDVATVWQNASTLSGTEIGVLGFAIQGVILNGTDIARVTKYDGTYPGGDGHELILHGVYESA